MESDWVEKANNQLTGALEQFKNTISLEGWKTSHKKSMKVYKLHKENLDCAKSEMEFDCSAEVAFNKLSDPSLRERWTSNVRQVQVKQEIENMKMLYILLKHTWGMSNREMLIAQKTQRSEEGTYYIIEKSLKDEEFYQNDTKNVKAEMNLSGFEIKPSGEGKCKVVYLVDYNPRGKMPGFCKRKTQSNIAKQLLTLSKTICS
mmetsp:Transcript_4057/g.6141  ORF Transcript_4057/g.6141 Transcript_4057/m.6141 type:complete len:203 (-) Transcript_4057:28-636(-)